MKGSLSALCGGAFAYILAATGFGLLVSMMSSTQVTAVFASTVLSVMPTLQFSGMLTPVSSLDGPARVLGGTGFALGLILVVVGGAELFTGNALMVMAAVDGKIGLGALLRNWGVVYVGNLVGALGVAGAFWLGGLTDGALGQTAATVATAKAAGSAVPWLVKGALCNALVCLAVWLSFSARDTTGKVLAILWPISTFVLLGLEHSIANMFFFPLGLLAGAGIALYNRVKK